MVDEAVLRPLFDLLQDRDSAERARAGLENIIGRTADKPSVVRSLNSYVSSDTSLAARMWLLRIGVEHTPELPEIIDLALTLSTEANTDVRAEAIDVLIPHSNVLPIHSRLIAMLQDDSPQIRNRVIDVVADFDLDTTPAASASNALYVIADPTGREEALDVLNDLEGAVKTLQDLGELTPGQHEIIDDLILPDINELRDLLGTEYADYDTVLPNRKKSLITLSGLFRTTQAISMGSTGIANVDEAVENVRKAGEFLAPIISDVGGLIF